MLIKLNCQCGTRYSFDAEPVNGLMPFAVACPTCGADGTAAANAIIAQTAIATTQPTATPSSLVPQAPAPTAKPRLRTVGAHSPPAPTAAAAAPVADGGEMCSRHFDKPASAH